MIFLFTLAKLLVMWFFPVFMGLGLVATLATLEKGGEEDAR